MSRRLTTKPDVVRTSEKRCLIYDVFKTSYLRRLQDVQFMTSWRRFICVVLKTSNLRRLEDVDLRRLEDVNFTTSSRSLIYVILGTLDLPRLEDVQFKTSSRRLQNNVYNVIVTSYSVKRNVFFHTLYCMKYSENFKCSFLG